MDYNELEAFIKNLFNRYFNKYRMSVDDKKDVIQDSMLQLFKKEQEGVLTGDVENNKNYIFITVRNFVLKQVYPTKNAVEYRETLPDTHNTPSTIEQSIDNTILSNQIRNAVKSKRFTNEERTIISGMLNGYMYSEMQKMLGNTDEKDRYGLSWLKDKIRDELNPKLKYLVEYENITYGFRTKGAMSKHLKMSIIQLNNYLSLGKTQFPKYKIHIL